MTARARALATVVASLVVSAGTFPAATSAMAPITVDSSFASSLPATDHLGAPRPLHRTADSGFVESACSGTSWLASSPHELVAAIECFNIATPGDYTVGLEADLTLGTIELPTIDPLHEGARLKIDGRGRTIVGSRGVDTIRTGDATVELSRLTLTGGRRAVVADGAVTISHTVVTGNGTTADGGQGGGIAVSGSGELHLVDSTISGNTGRSGAGLLVRVSSHAAIERSTVRDNVATESGGGIQQEGLGSLVISHSVIDANTAPQGGGIASTTGLTLLASTVSHNVGEGSGGIHSEGPTLIRNSTISGNVGRGVYHSLGSLRVEFSTVTRNVGGLGAGLTYRDTHGTFVTVIGSVIADNVNASTNLPIAFSNVYGALDGGARGDGIFHDSGGNFMEDGALLAPLADNGRNTPTHTPLAGSPVIDLAGDLGATPQFDQRGTPRPAGAAPDAGAVEAPDTDRDTIVDANDNCSNVDNADQADVDLDGVGNACDPTDDSVAFTTLRPRRFVDTRSNGVTLDGIDARTGPIPAGQSRSFWIAGRGEVPEGVRAVIANVTTVDAFADGHITVYPCTESVPNASSGNYRAREANPNEIIAPVDEDGVLCIYSHSWTDIVIDIVGYVSEPSPYTPIVPMRYADTRDQPTFDGSSRSLGPLEPGTIWEIPVSGRGPVPSDAVGAVLNVTVTRAEGPGHLTVFPCTPSVPVASSLNYQADVSRPNELISKLSPSGAVCITAHTRTHVVVDVVGYLEPSEVYTPVAPARFADSRSRVTGGGHRTFDGAFQSVGPIAAGSVWRVQIAGRGTVPSSARSAIVNVTVVAPTAFGHATVFPCEASVPGSSSLNYRPGEVRANELAAELSPSGDICIYTHAAAHYVVDVVGHDG